MVNTRFGRLLGVTVALAVTTACGHGGSGHRRTVVIPVITTTTVATAADATDVPVITIQPITTTSSAGAGAPPTTDRPPTTIDPAAAPPATHPPATTASSSAALSGSWRLTTYYTAVESYHHGSLVTVKGCPQRDCQFGSDDLGRYPNDFVQAVEDEGTGRITDGMYAGRYLNWSYDTGYWIDTIPSDTDGHALVPFQTAAADGLSKGTRFAVIDCGTQGGDPLDPAVCGRFRSATWLVRDDFTPGLGGTRHADLYVGEEDRPNFTNDDSAPYVDTTGARLAPR